MDPNSGKILLRFYLTVGLTENTTFDSVLHMLRIVLQTDVQRQAVVETCLGQNILYRSIQKHFSFKKESFHWLVIVIMFVF